MPIHEFDWSFENVPCVKCGMSYRDVCDTNARCDPIVKDVAPDLIWDAIHAAGSGGLTHPGGDV